MENNITVTTENAAAMSVWHGPVFSNVDEVQAEVNGTNMVLRNTPGLGARIDGLEAPDEFPGEKKRGLCGPFREVFSAPFLIVHGKNDEKGTQAAETIAEQWKKFSQGQTRIVSDGELDDQLIASHNLVLVGSEKTNAMIRKVSAKLPFLLDKD